VSGKIPQGLHSHTFAPSWPGLVYLYSAPSWPNEFQLHIFHIHRVCGLPPGDGLPSVNNAHEKARYMAQSGKECGKSCNKLSH